MSSAAKQSVSHLYTVDVMCVCAAVCMYLCIGLYYNWLVWQHGC